MTFSFDNETLEIPCSGCSQKFKETIRRLKSDPDLTCSYCGAVTRVNAHELRKVEQAVKKSLDDLGRAFRKLGK